MPNVLKELYLTSLGIMNLTYEKARQISNDLIKKGELARGSRQKFVTDLLEEARINTSEVSKIIEDKMEYLVKNGKPLKDKQDMILEDLKDKAKEMAAISDERIDNIIKEVMLRSRRIKKGFSGNSKELIEEILVRLHIPTEKDLRNINIKLDKLINETKKGE